MSWKPGVGPLGLLLRRPWGQWGLPESEALDLEVDSWDEPPRRGGKVTQAVICGTLAGSKDLG